MALLLYAVHLPSFVAVVVSSGLVVGRFVPMNDEAGMGSCCLTMLLVCEDWENKCLLNVTIVVVKA